MARAVEQGVLRAFGAGLAGGALCRNDAGYEEARRVWNGMIDRSPAMIARCRNVKDVVATVKFARDQDLLVAVRGGGHSASGLGVCDDGVVIDLSPMRAVNVDAGKQIVRVEGGARWGDVDPATHALGLATTGGLISTTGVGGLTLGGGIGWLMRQHGLASDNLMSVQIVTADGEVRTANASENADLFWGVRGGGGNFGVVTSFEFRLHPVTQLLGGLLVFPAARGPEVLRAYRDLAAAAPDELTMTAALMTSPEGAPIAAVVLAFNGPQDAGDSAIKPLRALGPVADQVAMMPYPALQTMLDGGFPPGLQVYWHADFLKALPDQAIDALCEVFNSVTSPLSAILVEQMGGAVARKGADETAFAHRSVPFNLAVISRWTDPSQRDRHTKWARGVNAAMQPFTSGGVYVNYLGVDDGEDRVRAAYGPAKYQRLAALKQKYDPTNLFRVNQNVKPA